MALHGDRARLYEEEAKRKTGIVASPAAAAAWAACRGSSTASFFVGTLDAAGKVLDVAATGATGGLAALRAACAPDAVSWCAFSFSAGGGVGASAPKHAFLVCVGSGVGAMKKGKVALQKGGVQAVLDGAAADAGVYQGVEELTDEAVLAKLRAHAPGAELLA